MKVEKVNIEGLLVIEPDVFQDSRGYFFESFNINKYEELGIGIRFVQDNISKSKKGTIRGLHYQVGEFAQGKLCSVIQGSVIDIAVDIRNGSPTYGQHFLIELSDVNKKQIWIPKGFAHGFAVTTEDTIFTYKCTSQYDKASERTIIYNDSDLKINWQINNPNVSDKDLNGIPFKNIERDFIY